MSHLCTIFFLLFLFFFFKRSAPASNAITNTYIMPRVLAKRSIRQCRYASTNMHLSFLLVLNHIFSPAALPKPRPLPPGLDLARGRVCKFNPFCTHHQTTAREDGVAFLFSLAISRLLLHVLFLFLSFLLSFFHSYSYILSSFIFFSFKKNADVGIFDTSRPAY